MEQSLISPLTIQVLGFLAIAGVVILALKLFFPIIFRLSMTQVLYQASQLAINQPEEFLSKMLSPETSGKERILEEFKKFKKITDVKYGGNKTIKALGTPQTTEKFTFSAEATIQYHDESSHTYNVNFKTTQGKNQIYSIRQII